MDDVAKVAAAECGCRYTPAYSGRCGRLISESGFCKAHTGIKCGVCGEQATNECNHTGQFVCGFRLCNNCEGFNDQSKSSGSWGFMNHSHQRKPVERRAHPEPRSMVAADIGLANHLKEQPNAR